jgi:hypothetical protein
MEALKSPISRSGIVEFSTFFPFIGSELSEDGGIMQSGLIELCGRKKAS